MCYKTSGVWLFSLLFAFPPVVGWSRYDFVRARAICTIRWSTSASYTVVAILFGVCLPFVVMVTSYLRIFRKFRQSSRRIGFGLDAGAAVRSGEADSRTKTCKTSTVSVGPVRGDQSSVLNAGRGRISNGSSFRRVAVASSESRKIIGQRTETFMTNESKVRL